MARNSTAFLDSQTTTYVTIVYGNKEIVFCFQGIVSQKYKPAFNDIQSNALNTSILVPLPGIATGYNAQRKRRAVVHTYT